MSKHSVEVARKTVFKWAETLGLFDTPNFMCKLILANCLSKFRQNFIHSFRDRICSVVEIMWDYADAFISWNGFTGQNQKTLSMDCDMCIILSDYHVSVYFKFEAKADIQIQFRNRAISTRFLVLAMTANSFHSGCKQNYRGEYNYCTIWPDNVRSIKRRHCAIIKWKPLLDNTNRLSAKLFSNVVFLFILKGLIVVRLSARMAPRSWADLVSWDHIRSPSGEMEPFKKTAGRPANRNKRAMTSSSVPQHTANDSCRQSR